MDTKSIRGERNDVKAVAVHYPRKSKEVIVHSLIVPRGLLAVVNGLLMFVKHEAKPIRS